MLNASKKKDTLSSLNEGQKFQIDNIIMLNAYSIIFDC